MSEADVVRQQVITYNSQLKRLNNAVHMIASLQAGLEPIWRAYHLLAPNGLSGGGDGGIRGNEHSDPTGSAVAAFQDGMHQQIIDLDEAIDGIIGTMVFVREIETRAATILARRAAEVPTGSGWCTAHCGHYCPGTSKTEKTVEDRLSGGLCSACRSYRARHDLTDIADLRRVRRGNSGKCQCDDCVYQAERHFVPKVVA